MFERPNCGSSSENSSNKKRSWPLVSEFLDYLRKAGMAESGLQNFSGPAKHFLIWIGGKGSLGSGGRTPHQPVREP